MDKYDTAARSVNPWGPWSPGVKGHDERCRQLRSLAALAAVWFGSGHELVGVLRQAETDAMAFVKAEEMIDKLPPLHRRRLISVFSAITWPKVRP